MTAPGYAPDLRLALAGRPAPAALRSSITAVTATCGMGEADRFEMTLANEALRWLDHDLFGLDTAVELALGYAPEPPQRVFAGEVVGSEATFPSSGMPTLMVVAQDRRTRMASATASRWFGVPVPNLGVMPVPDPLVAPALALEHGLLPQTDPLGSLLGAALAVVEAYQSADDPGARQRTVRKQTGQSTLEFLRRIAAENAWELVIDHAASPAGLVLRLLSPAAHIAPEVTLAYGSSLLEFAPRVSTVGQIAAVSVRVWRPSIRLELTVTAGYDWDRQALTIEVAPGFGLPFTPGKPSPSWLLADEPVSLADAPRVVLGNLLPALNRRLTATGSCAGNPAIRAGHVLRIEGVGETYGGLWRVVSVTQSLDGGGWRTSFDLRKEIWFGSVPRSAQGAVRIQGGLATAGAPTVPAPEPRMP